MVFDAKHPDMGRMNAAGHRHPGSMQPRGLYAKASTLGRVLHKLLDNGSEILRP